MSTYTVTVGKGKAVHTATDGATLCGTEKRAGDTLVLLNSVEDNTCKNCAKLVPALDNTTEVEETENMADEHLNDMTDAQRYAEAMKAQGKEVTYLHNADTGGEIVRVKHRDDAGSVTTIARWNGGDFVSAGSVMMHKGGHVRIDLGQTDIAEATYGDYSDEDTRQIAAA